MSGNNNSLWSNGRQDEYQIPSAAERGNQMAGTWLDPFGDVSGLWNDMMGFTSQNREMAFQEHMLDREQEFALDYSSKMQAMMEAGINPLTAAAGLAGSSGAAQPAVSGSVGHAGGSAAVDAASGLISAYTGGAASLADAAFKNGTLAPTIEKLTAEASTELERLGLTSAERQIAETTLKYADDNAIRDLQIKRVNINVLSQQYKNLKAMHENIIAEYDKIIAEKGLALSQQEYYDALKSKTDEEIRWMNVESDFWKENGFDLNANGIHNIVAHMVANGRDADAFLEKYIDYGGRYQFAVSDAEQSAIDKYAYSIGYRRQLGENAADVVNGKVGGPVDFLNRILLKGVNIVDSARTVFSKGVDSSMNWIRTKINEGQYNAVRNQFQDELEDLRKIHNPDFETKQLIDGLETILQLSNSELYDYFVKGQ